MVDFFNDFYIMFDVIIDNYDVYKVNIVFLIIFYYFVVFVFGFFVFFKEGFFLIYKNFIIVFL